MVAQAGKYLTFELCDEEYGLEILKVREIVGYIEATVLPKVEHYVKGVINLRGQVIPIIDLRLRFGMDAFAVTEKTCIIVIEVLKGDTRKPVGIVVDSVSEVLDVSGDIIEPSTEFNASIDQRLIVGLAKVQERIVMLLDVDSVFSESMMV